MSSPPLSGLPSSPAFKASQRRHEYRAGQLRPQHSFEGPTNPPEIGTQSNAQPEYPNTYQNAIEIPHAPRLVQGITLRSTHELPDRFRSIFGFPCFNAVQSKCFDIIYRTNDNFVLSSPTGSGKTVAFELAICRLINSFSGDDFKIVYQAPTKSLCSERQRDWSTKFRPFGLECAELTGDTDLSQMRNVQNASIIVTTPEKWDSMTRKWKDHIKLMKMIKLFLIDEVHMLKEERGAVLEVVVSRMKSIGSDVRFIALSASIPNSGDIASWLGRNPMAPQTPALREVFGEDFRPVKLQKFVVGYNTQGNDFAFEKALDSKFVVPAHHDFVRADLFQATRCHRQVFSQKTHHGVLCYTEICGGNGSDACELVVHKVFEGTLLGRLAKISGCRGQNFERFVFINRRDILAHFS